MTVPCLFPLITRRLVGGSGVSTRMGSGGSQFPARNKPGCDEGARPGACGKVAGGAGRAPRGLTHPDPRRTLAASGETTFPKHRDVLGCGWG